MFDYKYKTLADDPLSKMNSEDNEFELLREQLTTEERLRIEKEWKKVFYFEHGYYPKNLEDGKIFLERTPSFGEFMESFVPGFNQVKPLYENTCITESLDSDDTVIILDPNVQKRFRQQSFKEYPVDVYNKIRNVRYSLLEKAVNSISDACYDMMIAHDIMPVSVAQCLEKATPVIIDQDIQKYSWEGISVYMDSDRNLLNAHRNPYYGISIPMNERAEPPIQPDEETQRESAEHIRIYREHFYDEEFITKTK